MKESSTYQAILAEGRAEGVLADQSQEARRLLRVLDGDLLGEPDSKTVAAIERIEDLSRLEDVIRQTRQVSSWQELLAPPPGRRSRRSAR